MRAILALKSLALALAVTLSAVAAQESTEFTPRMAEPIVVNPAKIVVEGKRLVFIYYASETRDAEGFQATLQRLRKIDKKRAQQLADRVEKDVRGFSQIVDKEAETLLKEVRQCESESGVAVVVFTTRDSRDGFFRYVSSDDDQIRREEFRLRKFKSEGYRAYPLSHPRVFAEALQKVAADFDPQRHTFILVTKSHGGEDYAMTGLTGKLSAESQAELAEYVAENPCPDVEGLNEEDDLGLSGKNGLGAIAPKFGTKKDKYFSIVEKCGMDFQAVFVEACDSQLPTELANELPKNIGRVYTAETGLNYQTLDYGKLLRSETTVADALHQQLAGEME